MALDNYQGEESDIVIISLTRSNSRHDIGFMQSTERVNVMLSRARNALIMIGNVETFQHARKGEETWRPLLDNLRKGGHIYEGFPVKCERHPTTIGLLVRFFVLYYQSMPFDDSCRRNLPKILTLKHQTGVAKSLGKCIIQSIICCLRVTNRSGVPLNCGIHNCTKRCHFDKDHSKSLCRAVIYARCSNGHDISHLCHKGPTSLCPSCEKETKRAEKQKRDDIKRKAKEERNKTEHELKMAELERKIQEERQKIRDVQLETEREQAQLQKESDLRDTREMVEKARRQKQNLTTVAGNDSNSSSVSSPVVPQNPAPTQPPQPPVSNGAFYHFVRGWNCSEGHV